MYVTVIEFDTDKINIVMPSLGLFVIVFLKIITL